MNKNKNKQTLRANHTTPGTHRNNLKEEGGNHPPQNKQLHKLLINIIFAYSPKKNSANPMEEYSTLKPATNSASASGRLGSQSWCHGETANAPRRLGSHALGATLA